MPVSLRPMSEAEIDAWYDAALESYIASRTRSGASFVRMIVGCNYARRRPGRTFGSIGRRGATAGEGAQNLLCAAQGGAVLIGLAATAAFAWTWVDPVIALLLAAWVIREGTQAWRGEDCCWRYPRHPDQTDTAT